MQAWQFTGAHQPLARIERDDPVPGEGEVVVAVRAAGLCHSDVGFLEGVIAPAVPTPLILGHEVAGDVVDIGPGVVDFGVGDRVVVAGPEEFTPGWSADGGYATRCLAKASGLLRLADTVTYIQGATATDAGATSYGAVMQSGQLEPGQRVGIIGLGGLGMTGARIAVVNGGEVYAAEPRQEAWSLAKEAGVLEVVEDVRDLAPYDLDLIVDFAGFGTTTVGAISAIRPGGLVVQVGLGRDEATISTVELIAKAVTLRGSRGGLPGAVAAVLRHIASGELEIRANTTSFDEIPEGLERLKTGDVVGRLVAVMDD